MVLNDSRGSRSALFRFAALLLSVFLISLGASDLFTCSWAYSVDEEEPDYPHLYEDVAEQLRDRYLDQDRIDPRARKLVEKALSTLENVVDEIYVENSDPENPFVEVHVDGKSKVISLAKIANLREAVDVLEDLTEFIRLYYHGKRTINDIRYYVMNGFLSGLDPHTQVFNPKAFRDFSVHIEGEIFGVGMYVGSIKGDLTVRKVLKSTPAERAGFKRGDRILKIGEESTVNMDVNEAVKKIRGSEYSKIVLTVKRRVSKDPEEWATIPIEVRRERVTIPSVVSKLIKSPPASGGSVPPAGPEGEAPALGYVQVNNFDKNTVPSLKEGLKNLRQENGNRDLAGLILDLRENSGGLLQQAEAMADMFIAKGELYWIAQKKSEIETDARNEKNEPRYPMVVLANEHSASGAEIVTGALQKNFRALILGTSTFGKGSVQQLHSLAQGWQLKITVSEYLIPGKISIQENGVVPDIRADRAMITDKIINIFPNRRIGTETDYGDHLVSRYAKKEEPAERIQYLAKVEDPDAEDLMEGDPEGPEPAGYGEVDPDKDMLVQIGSRLIACALKDPPEGGTFRSDEFLKRHAADIDEIRKGSFSEIVKGLKEKGIDWSDGSNPDSPSLHLTVEHSRIQKPSMDKEDPLPKPYLLLRARLENRSDRPIWRIKGITDSDYYLFKELEFLFGKVDPGAVVERTVEVPIPHYPLARNDAIGVTVSGPDGKSILEKEHEVIFAEEPRPSFAYSATLLDRKKVEPLRFLSSGTEAILKVSVFNRGKSTAHKGVAILRNETGPEVFLEPPGRIEFTELAPDRDREMEFSFRILPASQAKRYKFELGMIDSYSGESLTRELLVPESGSEEAGFQNGERFHPPIVEAATSASSMAASEAERGSGGGGSDGGDDAGRGASRPLGESLLVTDRPEVELTAKIAGSQAPFNAWVTVTHLGHNEEDPDKVFYQESRGTEPLTFTTRVPLMKGSNPIYVVASDRNGLQEKKVIIVRRR